MDLDSAKQEFYKLRTQDFGSDRVLELLLEIYAGADLTPDEKGWVLWNVCDRYALAHDPTTQHRYQTEFFELIKACFPERGHWVVCDGTQANSQIRGGYLDFWLGCYQFANETTPLTPENRGVRFEAHRTSAGSFTQFEKFDLAQAALSLLGGLLEEDSEWVNQAFSTATYMTLLAEFYAAIGQAQKLENTADDLVGMLDGWLGRLEKIEPAKIPEWPMFGSWEAHNAARPPSAVYVGIHNAACGLTKAGLFPAAERLFRIRWDWGRMPTAYGEALFLLSCWRNRGDKEEVANLYSQCTRLSPEHLTKFTPEIADLLTSIA